MLDNLSVHHEEIGVIADANSSLSVINLHRFATLIVINNNKFLQNQGNRFGFVGKSNLLY